MNLIKCALLIQFYTLILINSSVAADINKLWGEPEKYKNIISNFQLKSSSNDNVLNLFKENQNLSAVSNLQLIQTGDLESSEHLRFSQQFKNIPLLGYQVIVHPTKSRKMLITGTLITNVESDLSNHSYQISESEAKEIILKKDSNAEIILIEKKIYIDKQDHNTAKYTYDLLYKTRLHDKPELVRIIVDADRGETLKKWYETHHVNSGTGIGGVDFQNLNYREGHYQFGNQVEGLNQFGNFPIYYSNHLCGVSNEKFIIINFENYSFSQLPFSLPLSYPEIQQFNIKPYMYQCSLFDQFNYNDSGFAPVNGGYSPINDVTYFLNKTYEMYQNVYHMPYPVGKNLPIYVFTHIKDYSDAVSFSVPNPLFYPQQMAFGNGDHRNAPLTAPGICSHEFAHKITSRHSNLFYEGESGGMNESFSDMAHFALLDYLSNDYPFIWSGSDWTIGLSISKVGMPTRLMNNPTFDSVSIDHASDYHDELDVHESSGVYNKAFYLLSTSNGWTPLKAFGVFLYANMNYWTPFSDFDDGACGVIYSGQDLDMPVADIEEAFLNVGVSCPFT